MKAEIISRLTGSRLQLPLFADTCQAGYPSPAIFPYGFRCQ